ncbi:MAG: sarcosine oxidase subunit gamma [Aliishimia sp.]
MADLGLELVAKSPCAGMLPMRIGKLVLSEDAMCPLTLLMPYDGADAALSTALEKAHGVSLPAANESSSQGDVSAIWFGRGQVLLRGVPADDALSATAALSDQSDAWTSVVLQGVGAEIVLSRLVPVDLRIATFPIGQTARTLVGHMNGSVTRISADSFRVMVFRSMAQSLVHEFKDAMETVAAQ